ncbi:MBL fold metallo-hydrolase [Nocardiopsis sp. Huas11]|uniref:MBL fold metallo-hydrolase n=1 Tax=Nocardiopsis sp. Huas11 TaxID=2183912 RepID=UPI0035130218
MRGESAAPGRGPRRPLPAPPDRPRRPVGGELGRPRRTGRGGQGRRDRALGGERSTVGAAGLSIEALRTGGHTPGSILLHVGGEGSELFTGDALLAGSLGRTDGPGGDERRLRSALSRHCARLPDATTIHPGHGEATTLRAQRRLHRFLRTQARP